MFHMDHLGLVQRSILCTGSIIIQEQEQRLTNSLLSYNVSCKVFFEWPLPSNRIRQSPTVLRKDNFLFFDHLKK